MLYTKIGIVLNLWVLSFLPANTAVLVAEDQPIRIYEGTNMAASLSPDGKLFALDLQGVIWLLSATGGAAVPISDMLGDNHEPTWSPDGKQLAFQSYRNGAYHLCMINRDGSGLKEITNSLWDDREPCWSADGKSIYFSSDRGGEGTNIWKVNLSDQHAEQITFGNADHHPSTSPQGDRLLYVSDQQESALYLWEAGVSTLFYSSTRKIAAPSWSPDGQQAIFIEYNRETSRLRLWQAGSEDIRTLSSPEDDIFPFRPCWRNNEQFYFTANGHINKQSVRTNTRTLVPFIAEISLTQKDYKRKTYDFDSQQSRPVLGIAGPVISPLGDRVAFSALGDIYIQEISSGKLTQITEGNSVSLDPEWSPDGTALLYVSDVKGKMDLWQYDFNNNTSSIILESQADHPISMPVWSADKKKIAFYTKGALNDWGDAKLCILDIASNAVKSPIPPLFSPGKPSWSPDGKFLTASVLVSFSERYREGSNQFLLIDTENWQTRYINPDSTRNRAMRSKNGPIWSPDGKKIAYVQDGRLWYNQVNAAGDLIGKPIHVSDSLAESISWFGDSKRLLYLAVDHLQSVDIDSRQTVDIAIRLDWEIAYPKGTYTIWAGRLFNGVDSNYLENVDIIISGHRIQSIVPHREESTLPMIDVHDKTVMPGLFEMHAHQHFNVGEKLGKLWLSMGITTVREPGADPYDALERKEAWASGVKLGPRLFTTGGLMEGKRAFYGLSNSISSTEQAKLEIERAQKLDYDLVKTYVRFPDSLQRYVIEQAHALGIPVSSHDIFPATKYHIDAVEHFRGTSRRGYSPKQTALNKTYQDVFAILLGSGINITPTIVMHDGFQKAIHQYQKLLNLPQFKRFYSPSYIRNWKEREIPSNFGPNFSEFQKDVYKVVNEGGRLTAGTDAPFVPYGISLHVELWLYVDGGLSPFQALQTATINSARAIGVDQDLGTVEVGKLADLVIVDGDPLHLITDSSNVKMVVKNGQVYNIDHLLQQKL